MGTTNRRQPVTFNIPARENYNFLNIAEFKGIEISENPFETDVTSSSDALNVYVDENGALTTRPRLETKFSIDTSIMTKLLKVFNIRDGYLCLYQNGQNKNLGILKNKLFYIVRTSDEPFSSFATVNNLFDIFEKENDIYILTGTHYNVIKLSGQTYYLSEVDAYVPITTVGINKITYNSENNEKTIDVYGSDFERLNLLTNRYKQSYFWDGTYDPKTLSDYVEIENNYSETEYINNNNYYFIKYSSTNKILCREKNTKKIGYYNQTPFDFPDELTPKGSLADMNEDGSVVAVIYTGDSQVDNAGGLVVYVNGIPQELLINQTYNSFLLNRNFYDNLVVVSRDGNIVCASSDQNIIIYKRDITTGEYELFFTASKSNVLGVELSANGNIVLIKSGVYNNYETFSDLSYIDLTSETPAVSSLLSNENLYQAVVSPSGNQVFIKKYDANTPDLLYTNFLTDKTKIQNLNTIPLHKWFCFSLDEDKLYDYSSWSGGWLNLSNFKFIEYNLTNLDYYYHGEIYENTIPYCTTTIFSLGYKSGNVQNYGLATTIFDFNSIEPKLFITKELKSTDKNYADWLEKRNKFFKSTLTTRFDNNQWFASGNRIYFTTNNDPTYITSTNYNDLGDVNEEITGFNIASDSLLIAYKKDKLYFIQPTTIDEKYTYLYTETKNTFGNTAVGAPIVTTLREKPVQVNEDGIYYLYQAKNVQTSDLICQILNKNVNQKWLTEKDEVKNKCITLNRLYWTYFILNDNVTVKNEYGQDINKDITKVYLLDNRTESWFYWEFPIKTINAFVKDNITEFVDTNGNIYQLKNTEVVTPRGYIVDDEYFDEYDGKKEIINWYWESQILPFKTINYLKLLKNTTFIVSDGDGADTTAFNYDFDVFRKTATNISQVTVSKNLNFVRSITVKTHVPRFNFLKLRISCVKEQNEDPRYTFKNNKIRLLSVGFKFVLSELTRG